MPLAVDGSSAGEAGSGGAGGSAGAAGTGGSPSRNRDSGQPDRVPTADASEDLGSDTGPAPDASLGSPGDGGGACNGGVLSQSRWRDLGEVVSGTASAQAIVVVGADALVATTVGLFRRPLDGASPWRPAGLAGIAVRSLYRAKSTSDVLFAGLAATPSEPSKPPIWRSPDSGASWQPVGEELKDTLSSTPAMPSYDPVESFTSYVRPNGGEVFFANASGASVARSEDGIKWTYVDGGPGSINYACELHVPPGLGAYVYQGCEAPLDDSWIRRFGVDEVPVKSQDRVVSMAVLGNRRTNLLTSFSAVAGALYAGVEGGLVRVNAQGSSWLYQSGPGDDPAKHGYAYVKAVWVDTCAPQHFMFGGNLEGANVVLQLYESFDDGAHVTRLDAPAGLPFKTIDVEAGAASPDQRSFILSLTLDKFAGAPHAHVLVAERSPKL
jgi:hypothetical protein